MNHSVAICRACAVGLVTLFVSAGPGWAQPAENSAAAPAVSIDVANNPAVKAALEFPRKQPADYVRAIVNLESLGAAPLAKPIVDELLALEMTDEARSGLVAEVGTATLLRLARSPNHGASLRPFVETTMRAAATAAADPARITQLIAGLGAADTKARQQAIGELAKLGGSAVVPLAARLATPALPPAERQGILLTLRAMDEPSTPALLALLTSDEAAVASAAALVLADRESTLAAPLVVSQALFPPVGGGAGDELGRAAEALLGAPATPEVARRLLTAALDNHASGFPIVAPDEQGMVDWYLWDSSAHSLVPTRLTATDATLVWQSKLAAAAAQVDPDIPSSRARAARLAIEAQAVLAAAGVATPASLPRGVTPLADLSGDDVQRVLVQSLADGQTAAARAAVEEFGRRRDGSVLVGTGGRPMPLVDALESSHPEVRHAALAAIVAIDPPRGFAGASRVTAALREQLGATGQGFVLVASPRTEFAASVAGWLADAGLAGELAGTGGEAIAIAGTRVDIERIVLDMSLSGPEPREVLFQLRRMPLSARVPVALVGREEQLSAAKRLASEHWGVVALPRPHNAESAAALDDALTGFVPRDWPSAARRAAMAREAVAWATQLRERGRSFYNVDSLGRAIATAAARDTGTERFTTLAKLATPTAQTRLLDLASDNSTPLAGRQAAAKSFADSVERHGLLISTDTIAQQYERYNAGESLDADTQSLLSKLLDTIESPRTRARQQYREQLPLPPSNP